MVKINQNVGLVDSFFQSKISKLLINGVDEKISSFYLFVLAFFSKKSSIPLSINEEHNTGNLFFNEEVRLLINPNTKEISNNLGSAIKTIFLTDYKNFKKYSNETININAYEYAMDIKYFVHQELNYQNQSLIEFCINEPGLFFSEISKFEITNKFYESLGLKQETNQIVEIRKNIFSLKKNSNNIKDLYENIIAEVRYKKFNFLTY